MESEEFKSNFSETWADASRKFRAAADRAGARLEQIPLPHLDGALCVDVAVFQGESSSAADSTPRKILLYTAGQHGVEGYAGSAILIDLCDRMKRIALPAGGKVIFVHVMNPHGMREWRRWNHNNVDLNRNNGISQLDFMERANNPDPTYVKYNDFINPSRRISVCDCFTPRLLCLIAREGFSNGKQALAGGQSHIPSGLFFGGTEWQEGPKAVFSFLRKEGVSETNSNMEAFMHVDLHTGVGPYKHDSLLAENCFLPQLERIFGGKGDLKSKCWHLDGIGDWVQRYDEDVGGSEAKAVELLEEEPKGKDGVAYSAKGHIGGGLFYETAPPHMHKIGTAGTQRGKKCQLESAKWISLTQEFGTKKGTTMFQLLRAENAMTAEVCRIAEKAGESVPSLRNAPERAALFEAFCPSDASWRRFVVERGRVVFEKARGFVFE
eukprot:g2326.t1